MPNRTERKDSNSVPLLPAGVLPATDSGRRAQCLSTDEWHPPSVVYTEVYCLALEKGGNLCVFKCVGGALYIWMVYVCVCMCVGGQMCIYVCVCMVYACVFMCICDACLYKCYMHMCAYV